MGVDELVGTMLALQRLAVWFGLIHMQDTGHKVFRLVNHGQLLSGENDTHSSKKTTIIDAKNTLIIQSKMLGMYILRLSTPHTHASVDDQRGFVLSKIESLTH
jgi:hypothetical protein